MADVGEPEDIANVCALPLSDDARWITGVTINVDGGHQPAGRARLHVVHRARSRPRRPGGQGPAARQLTDTWRDHDPPPPPTVAGRVVSPTTSGDPGRPGHREAGTVLRSAQPRAVGPTLARPLRAHARPARTGRGAGRGVGLVHRAPPLRRRLPAPAPHLPGRRRRPHPPHHHRHGRAAGRPAPGAAGRRGGGHRRPDLGRPSPARHRGGLQPPGVRRSTSATSGGATA